MEKKFEHEVKTKVMKVKGCTMPKCTDLGGACRRAFFSMD